MKVAILAVHEVAVGEEPGHLAGCGSLPQAIVETRVFTLAIPPLRFRWIVTHKVEGGLLLLLALIAIEEARLGAESLLKGELTRQVNLSHFINGFGGVCISIVIVISGGWSLLHQVSEGVGIKDRL